ncbi:MAG: hypothetical protein ACRD2C_14890 [Acidimicrobiales bacterium]
MFSPAYLLGPVVTLGLVGLYAVVFFITADPTEGFLSDVFFRIAALLVLVAAPAALLVAWGEIDLSVFGTSVFAGWVYAETADTSVAAALLACAAVGVACGVGIGLARWLTRVPAALLTLGVGFLLQAIALDQIGVQGRAVVDGVIDGNALPVVAAIAVTALALGASFLGVGVTDERRRSGVPGPEVIAGFVLSGLAAGLFGGINVGALRFAVPVAGENVLLPLFTAVAIAGVVRGSGPIAPLAGAAAGVVVAMIQSGTQLRSWEPFGNLVLLGGLLLAAGLVGHLLHRALDAAFRSGTASRQPAPIGGDPHLAPPPPPAVEPS